jgi:hypothetical protein
MVVFVARKDKAASNRMIDDRGAGFFSDSLTSAQTTNNTQMPTPRKIFIAFFARIVPLAGAGGAKECAGRLSISRPT